MKPKYKFYATLLDAFQAYKDCDETWEMFWGNSDSPSISLENYRIKAKQEFIDKLNRVPFDSDKADRGTALNNVADGIARGYKGNGLGIYAEANGKKFAVPVEFIEWAEKKYGGKYLVPQKYLDATLPTMRGVVQLYGYADFLEIDRIRDLKTTTSYSFGKYKDGWQHIVYPYCASQIDGLEHITQFVYDIVVIKDLYVPKGATEEEKIKLIREGYSIDHFNEEIYNYNHEKDLPRLVTICEELIEFLKENECLIDKTKCKCFI